MSKGNNQTNKTKTKKIQTKKTKQSEEPDLDIIPMFEIIGQVIYNNSMYRKKIKFLMSGLLKLCTFP